MERAMAFQEVEALVNYYESVDRRKMRAYLLKKGLPIEAVTRLDNLWDETKTVAGKIIKIGKIIYCKILDFIAKYKHAAIGILVGAACGALASAIPLIGPLIAPVIAGLGALYGLACGAQMDTGQGVMQSVILIAKDFFALLIEIFNAILEG